MKNLLILFIVILFLIFSCQKNTDIETTARKGGVVRIALNTAIEDIFPLTSDEFNVEQIHQYMLTPTLVSFDAAGNALPNLANIWKIDKKKLSLTFILNPELKWNNNKNISSYDINYSYNLIKSLQDIPRFESKIKHIKNVEIIDSLSFRILFNEPVAEPLFFTNFPIFFSNSKYDTSNLEQLKKSYLDSFIGCGPFIISNYSKDSLVLKRNPNYFESLPYLNKVIFNFIGKSDSLLYKIIDEKIDFAVNLPLELISKKSIQNKFNILSYPEKGYTFIGWNLNSEFLIDRNIRKALSHAIDRQTLIDGILGGYGEIINGPLYFNHKIQNRFSDNLEFNSTKAESLLIASGWNDVDQNGFRRKGEKKLSIEMLVNNENPERLEIANNIKANLASLGIDIQLKLVTWKQLLSSIKLKTADAILLTWTDSDYYDPSLLFHSRAIDEGLNFMSYKSEVADSLIDNALFTWDKSKRDLYWHELRKTISNDLPCTFLFSQKIVVGYSKKINNVQLDSRGFLINIKEWWLNQRVN